MKKWLRRNRTSKEPQSHTHGPTPAPPPPSHHICEPGTVLLQNERRQRLVVLIKRSVSVTQEIWDNHYFYALERFAEVVQLHPASRQHHHSQPGGLLDHTLEVTLRALRLSAGVILPPGAEPEELLQNAERWRFGIFICGLLHDVGKVIGDQETVYKDSDGKYVHWQAWHGPMPISAQYVSRYRQTRGEHIHGLHEKLGITLLPFLLTQETSFWLTHDRSLLGQMMATLAASATGAGIIGELIRKSDRASTSENLGPSTGIQEHVDRPLHAKILEALQILANEGKIKRNMPGAGLWVDNELTYIVAKSMMEKVREFLLAAGHKSIPQSPLRLMQILNEHGLSVPPVEGGDIQQAIVKDEQRSWEQKLSFIVIPNETLWVSGTPNIFNGIIIPVDSKGNEIEHNNAHVSPSAVSATPANDRPRGAGAAPPIPTPDDIPPWEDHAPSAALEENDSRPENATPAPPQGDHEPVRVVSRNLSTKPAFKSKPGAPTSPLRSQSEFIAWVLNGIKYRRVRVNESGAPVHIVDDYVALITPKIFDLYLDDNKAVANALGKSRDKQLLQVQREVKKLNAHFMSDGEDFHRLVVRGPRRESMISALLIKRDQFPELDKHSPNPILERCSN